MPRNHALLALSMIALGWLIVSFTVWRLYPDQSPARLLISLGLGLMAWGGLWFPMEWLHRRREDPEGTGKGLGWMMERIWRRSGWGGLWVSALAMLFLHRALRLEWVLLFGLLLLGAELLWMATEPAPESKPPSAIGRRVGRR